MPSATKKIKLTRGKYAIVDLEDFARVSGYKWYASIEEGGRTYGMRGGKRINKKREPHISLHRFILRAKKGEMVDHVNGNTLDNRRANLRFCTSSENLQNTKRFKNNTSGFKGVDWNKKDKKWHARISVNSQRKFLGQFSDKIQAAKAYDTAAKKYFGKFARLNFKMAGRSWEWCMDLE